MKNLRKTRIAVLFLTLICCFASTSFAQHNHGGGGGSGGGGGGGHNHGGGGDAPKAIQPPHGGTLKKTGKYQIELVVNKMLKEDQMAFYLMKENLKPMSNAEVTGSVTFEFKDGTTTKEALTKRGDDHFVANLKKGDLLFCTVRFVVKGKVFANVFPLSSMGSSTGGAYTCSMHPEIQADAPGKCPKCGMNLVPTGNKKSNSGHGGAGHSH